MNMKNITVSTAEAHWNVSGTRILKYSLEMFNKELKEHKILSASDIDILQNKVDLQAQKWSEQWDVLEAKRKNRQEKEANKEEAIIRTEDAEVALNAIENLLVHTLSINDAVNWDSLKKKENFSEKSPVQPIPKVRKEYPEQPKREPIVLSFVEKIFKSKKEKVTNEHESRYLVSLLNWEEQKLVVEKNNLILDQEYEMETHKWNHEVEEWTKRKEEFINKQEEFNAKIESMKDSYLKQNQDSIVEYCDMVLNNSEYPESFPKSYEIEYNPENKILVVEYQLPSIKSFPTLKEVKYVASKNELKEGHLSESQVQKMFDEAMYKITLRTLHEIFEADVANAIEAVSFNGWVRAINRATGKDENNCILTVQIKKNEFMGIDLAKVDPKICFKSFKGVASSKLSTLTPIQPILQISKVDRRFVESYEVANRLDHSMNLAAMDWEDFEHLIRELFEREFASNGGEVKVTQASKDGGVDVVVFDPDPIRGGKMVIQAKRYTNTVSVSAVRDLYGTVLNEGATKGILVSTADYGPDAYEFAKGKPITLLNGANLLHLLEKHGHHAKIDLREAKKILSENN
ncbi:MAG: restriction endonuclease [Bacillota bacterium]